MMTTYCFTGRRPKDLCGYVQEKYNDFVISLVNYLMQFIDTTGKEKTQFISGGAQGFDQLAFWAVDLLKQSLPAHLQGNVINTVYVPFKGQQRIWKENGLFSRQQYDLMLQKADRVAYLQESAEARNEVVEALLNRNHMMVDASSGVIALYPGDDWQTAKGGTAECMRYANSKDKTIHQVRYTIENSNLVGIYD